MNQQKGFQDLGVGCFMKQTQLFNLKITLMTGKLCVTLDNIQDWIRYYKQYTELNVGDEIQNRIGINDIYHSFAQSCIADYEDDCSIFQNIEMIPFGQIYKNRNNPCFSVRGNGLITVYNTILDQRTHKLLKLQSSLRLDVLRFITEEEKIAILLARQRNNIENVYLKKLSQLQKQNSNLNLILKRYENSHDTKIHKNQKGKPKLKYRLRKKNYPTNIKQYSKKFSKKQKTSQINKQNKIIHKKKILKTLLRGKKQQKAKNTINKMIQEYHRHRKCNSHSNIQGLIQQYFLNQKHKKGGHYITPKQISKYLHINFHLKCSEKQIKQSLKIIRKKQSAPIIMPFTVKKIVRKEKRSEIMKL